MRVRLHNIGPIRDADIEIAPLTILVGPNGSGKTTLTSVTYACCLAHAQATEQAFELVDNPFASRQQRLRGERLTTAIGERWQEVFVERLDFELRRCCSPDLSALGRARRRGKEAGPRIEVASDTWCLPLRLEGDSLCIEKDSKSYRPIQLRIPADADPREVRGIIAGSLQADIPRRAVYFPAGRAAFTQTHTAMGGLIASALSGGYFQDATLGAIPGASADFMRFVAQVSPKRRMKLTRAAAGRLEKQVLRGRVRLEEDGGARRLLFMPEGYDIEWPLQNMATSVAELAPLVLYLRHVARHSDMLMIDEPESHLSPSSQVQLASVLGELSAQVSSVIIATHSAFLVSALSNLLLREQVNDRPPPDLAAFAFAFHDREDRGLGVDVKRIAIDPEQGFEIKQFAEIADEVFHESIQLYNQLHADSD